MAPSLSSAIQPRVTSLAAPFSTLRLELQLPGTVTGHAGIHCVCVCEKGQTEEGEWKGRKTRYYF